VGGAGDSASTARSAQKAPPSETPRPREVPGKPARDPRRAHEKPKVVEKGVYTHADGRREMVEVAAKCAEDSAGGGYAIYIPSRARERDVLLHRVDRSQENSFRDLGTFLDERRGAAQTTTEATRRARRLSCTASSVSSARLVLFIRSRSACGSRSSGGRRTGRAARQAARAEKTRRRHGRGGTPRATSGQRRMRGSGPSRCPVEPLAAGSSRLTGAATRRWKGGRGMP